MAGIWLPNVSQGQTYTITGETHVCLGQTYNYGTSPALDPNYNYTWTVTPTGAGTVMLGTIAGATIQWTTVGTATINLSGVNPTNSSTINATKIVDVNNIPAPFITSNVKLACQPLNDSFDRDKPLDPEFDSTHCQWVCSNSTVIYTANGAGGNYTWNAIGAISSSVLSPNTFAVTWGAPGNGSVTLTETNSANCSSSSSICVKIIEGPTADFYAMPNFHDDITICKHGTVVLIDQSTSDLLSPIVYWHWDFGDGTISNQSPGALNNPITHQYDMEGDYELVLTVTNACGCTSQYTMMVHVTPENALKIACPRVVCPDESAVYTVDKPCKDDSWSVIGGTILGSDAYKANIIWDQVDPNTGFGYVMYQSCDPCPMINVVSVPVVIPNANIQGPPAVCAGQQYIYRLPKWPTTTFQWSITGNGTIQATDQPNEIAVTAGSSGTFTLSVFYCNTLLKCNGNAEITVTIKPQATIQGPSPVCMNQPYTYSLSSSLSGTWTLTNPNNTIVGGGTGNIYTTNFTMPGVYRLSVVGADFCPPEEFLIKVNAIPSKPTALIGPDSACVGIPTLYSAGMPIAGTSFQWYTSAGTVNAFSGDQSYITFSGNPNFTVSVVRVTTDGAGCISDPLSKTVLSAIPPLVFSGPPSPVCHSTEYNYALNFTNADAYEWSIHPSTLGSVTANGTTSSPKVLWNLPTNPNSIQTGWLVVKVHKCGQIKMDSIEVQVRGIPTLTITTNDVDNIICDNETIVFTATPSFAIGSASETIWTSGGGASTTTPSSFQSTYTPPSLNVNGTTPINFTGTITVANPNGCPGSISANTPVIKVKPAPKAFVSPQGTILECGVFSLDLTGTETTGMSGTSFAWHGTQSSPPTTPVWTNVHTYGSYYVTVSNTNGCFNNSNIVNIEEYCSSIACGPGNLPTISLNGSNTVCGHVSLSGSYSGSGPWYQSEWAYPSSSQNVTITNSGSTPSTLNADFNVAGIYTFGYNVRYTNTAGDTCIAPSSKTITVPYISGLNYGINCSGTLYQVTLFDNSSVVPQYVNTLVHSYSYRITGSGPFTPIASGSMLSTSVSLAPGNYEIREIIQEGSQPACTSIVAISLPALPVAAFSISSSFSPACVNDVVITFNDLSTPSNSLANPISYMWNFDDALFNAFPGSVSKVYSAPNNPYSIMLTTINQYGCSSNATHPVYIVPNQIKVDNNPPMITALPTNPCQGETVTLQFVPNALQSPNYYTWFEQGNQLTGPIIGSTYDVFNSGGYWTLGTDIYGCRVISQTKSVDFNQVPLVSINGNGNQCVNSQFTLSTQSYPGMNYLWSNGATGTSITLNLSSPGTYTYTVKITDPTTGCSHTSPVFTVTISPLPTPPVLSYSVLNCDPYEVQLNASAGAGNYIWNNGMNGPVIQTNNGGAYQVIYTNSSGCSSQNSFYVPKDPAQYLWIFPTGCFCQRLSMRPAGDSSNAGLSSIIKCTDYPPYITGPIIWFPQWRWLKNGIPVAGGSGIVADYTLPAGPGVYNLFLNDGNCQVTSGDMYYTTDTCKSIGQKPTSIDDQLDEGDASSMKLVPNPAKEQTTVLYRFEMGNAKALWTIEVFDALGRKLAIYKVKESQGQLSLPLSGYTSGMYQVIMKENGKMIRHSKLSVTH